MQEFRVRNAKLYASRTVIEYVAIRGAPLKYVIPAIAALLLAACATTSIPREAEAVRDFVALSGLERIEAIRMYRQLRYGYVNDYFVIVVAGERHYLVEFTARCYSLRAKTFTAAMVDHRHDPSYLIEKDTIRGCVVGKIYEATPEQLIEVKQLSRSIRDQDRVPSEA